MRHAWRATPLSALLLVLLFSSTSLFASANTNAIPNPKAPAGSGPEDDAKTPETFKPCQIRSPNTNFFYDLNPIHIMPPQKDADDEKSFYSGWGEEVKRTSWHARGYDYQANFTINFCGPVVEEVKNVVDVDRGLWQNVSAYYTMDDKVFSIGQQNHELVFRGRKLLLNYTNGSPCPEPDDDEDDGRQKRQIPSPTRRKSTLISLLCERDPTAPKATVTFVGTTDQCAYFFEARSIAACPALNTEKQRVGPSGVFGLIFGIAIIVYVVGGVVYQRAVLHQRGWRQLPNYTLWSSIATFVGDVLVIVFSSFRRCSSSGSRKMNGYGHVANGGANGYAHGPSLHNSPTRARDGRDEDDETTLIDQLDEVWDD